MKTRTYLFLMAAAILIPVVLVFWIGVSMLLDWERASRIQRVQETARATALLVDREIAVAEALLRTIANSDSLAEENYLRLHRLAGRNNASDPLSWTTLVDAGGRPIFNTLVPYGTVLRGSGASYAADVLGSGKTRVSGYFFGPMAQRPVVSVDVPSPRGAQRRYVVSQIFDARYFERVFAGGALAPGWLVGIFDARGVTIAHNRHGANASGRQMHPALRAATMHAASGVLRHVTGDGVEVYGIYMHGGEVAVHSEGEGRGCTFTLGFPLHAGQAPGAPHDTEPPHRSDRPALDCA